MPNLWILTNEKKIVVWDANYVRNYLPTATRYTVEMVSEEMFEAIVHYAGHPEYSQWVAAVLYAVLDQRWWISNN